MRQILRLAGDLPNSGGKFLHRPPHARAIRGQCPGQVVDGEGDADQVVAKPVVQVLPDAALLVAGGFEDFRSRRRCSLRS